MLPFLCQGIGNPSDAYDREGLRKRLTTMVTRPSIFSKNNHRSSTDRETHRDAAEQPHPVRRSLMKLGGRLDQGWTSFDIEG
jgi:hypothetical protein